MTCDFADDGSITDDIAALATRLLADSVGWDVGRYIPPAVRGRLLADIHQALGAAIEASRVGDAWDVQALTALSAEIVGTGTETALDAVMTRDGAQPSTAIVAHLKRAGLWPPPEGTHLFAAEHAHIYPDVDSWVTSVAPAPSTVVPDITDPADAIEMAEAILRRVIDGPAYLSVMVTT